MNNRSFVSVRSVNSLRAAGLAPEHGGYDSIPQDKLIPHVSPEEFDRYAIQHEAFNELVEITKWQFRQLTGFDGDDIDVIYRYQRGANAYIAVGPRVPFFIHVDESLDLELLDLTLTMMLWMRDYDSDPLDTFFFKQMLYSMNELFILGNLPGDEETHLLIDRVAGDMHIYDWAADLYWSMIAFTIAHELAHAYQMKTNPTYWTTRSHGSEYHADALGYQTLLTLIRAGVVGSFQFEEKTCLAPLMYLDYFQLARVTDEVLYNASYVASPTHPSLKRRKNALLKLYERSGLHSEDANVSYQWFLFLYDEYVRMLGEYSDRGALEGIKRMSERFSL